MNLWMKRAIGAAALGGGLLALSAGAAGAQEVSADATARLGRPTSAPVRVCADGRVLSRLLGCTDRPSGTVQAGRAGDGSGAIRARVRVPRAADADVSIGTRRDRPATTASGQASATRRARAAAAADTSPSADATATLSRPRAGRLLEVGPLAGEAPAGIGVLESGPIASGNQVDVDAGDISPSVPVTVCGNSAGVLGDASASCGASGATTPGSGSGVDLDTILDTVLDTSTDGATDPGAGVDIGVDVGIGGAISTGGIIAPTPAGDHARADRHRREHRNLRDPRDPRADPGRRRHDHRLRAAAGGGLRLRRPAVHRRRKRPAGPVRRRAAGRGRPVRAGNSARRRNGRRWEPVTPPRRPGSKR